MSRVGQTDICDYCGHDYSTHVTSTRYLPTKCHMAKVDSFEMVVSKCPCKIFLHKGESK